jgi:predicted patatin/cPLA2 family phospholipase
MSKTLIVQGGGFRTGFTAGILDAFISLDYFPFDKIIGVSGGAISASFFMSRQFGFCAEAMKILARDPEFVNFKYIIRNRGYMNIDHFRLVADELVPFDMATALQCMKNTEINFVATDRLTGKPIYLSPTASDWIDLVIASSTLPFVTKGVHQIRGLDLMDGGWSDSIPVEWAVGQGATEVLILRTNHIDKKIVQTWPDYFGSIYFKNNPDLSKCFGLNHNVYNNTIDFLANPPKHVKIEQLWPEENLKCGNYSYSVDRINSDHRYGLHVGINYVRQQLALSTPQKNYDVENINFTKPL